VPFDEAARKEYAANSRNLSAPITDEELREANAKHLPPAITKGSWRNELKKGFIRIPLR
jgi:hypothetical protein